MRARKITDKHVMVALSIGRLLALLEAQELAKPSAIRRKVPSVPKLADMAGVHRGTMYNLVNGNVKQENLEQV